MNINPALATKPSPRVSTKYQFQNTQDLVKIFEEQGFILASTKYARVNKRNGIPNFGRLGYQKHLLRFDHPELNIDGTNRVQIVLRNSHDGTESIWLGLGVYRLVCSNGLVVGKDFFSTSIFHKGTGFKERIQWALNEVIEKAAILKETIKLMQNTELKDEQVDNLIKRTIQIKLGDNIDMNLVDINSFKPRREEDKGNDLYTVLNRLQEVLIRGGIKYKSEVKPKTETPDNVLTFRNNSTRKITSVQAEVDLNQAIFDEALKILAA